MFPTSIAAWTDRVVAATASWLSNALAFCLQRLPRSLGTPLSPPIPVPAANEDTHVMITLSGAASNRTDPYGARKVIAAIRTAGARACTLLQDRLIPRRRILDRVAAAKPRAVWVSIQPTATNTLDFIRDLLHRVTCPVILGNVGAAWLSKEDLQALGAPVVVVLGRGEEPAFELSLLIEHGKFAISLDRLGHIPHLRLLIGNELVDSVAMATGTCRSIPPASVDLQEAIARGDGIDASSSFGCAGSCVFCTQRLLNNGSGYQIKEDLYPWLSTCHAAGMTDEILHMTDDDLAGNIQNLKRVTRTIQAFNQQRGTSLKFTFSTRAEHLVGPKDTANARQMRRSIWQEAVESGLRSVFLGLESGSPSQIRRYGKGTSVSTNYDAVRIAHELGVELDVGMIPIDAGMSDGTGDDTAWRQELLEDAALMAHVVKHFGVRSCFSFLSTMRCYYGSPWARILARRGQLGPFLNTTGEYAVRYESQDLLQALDAFGPCLVEYDASRNPLFWFKRELTGLHRGHPTPFTVPCVALGEELGARELAFVKRVTIAASQQEVRAAQLKFIQEARTILGQFIAVLDREADSKDALVSRILKVGKAAIGTLGKWEKCILAKRHWRIDPYRLTADS